MSIVRAKEAFAYTDQNGLPRVVRVGDLFDDSDSAVAKRSHLFEPVDVTAERRRASVEDASAEPGQLRSLGGRKSSGKSSASKSAKQEPAKQQEPPKQQPPTTVGDSSAQQTPPSQEPPATGGDGSKGD